MDLLLRLVRFYFYLNVNLQCGRPSERGRLESSQDA